MPQPQPSQPQPGVPQPRKRPELVPPPERPRPGRKWLPIAAILLVIAAGIFWQLQQSTGFGGGGGGAATSVLPSVATEEAELVHTIRLTGTTKAERFVSITSPRITGSRSRRGSSASGQVGVKSNITVRSTTTVSNSSSIRALSQTGTVSSSSGAASRGGGTGGGGGGPSSAAFQAATSRTGSAGAGTGGNIVAAGAGGSGTMGASGIGSTRPFSVGGGGGGGGGGRGRGDFHLQLQTLIESGVMVKKGDVIAEFDRQYMETRLDDYVTSVVQQNANLEKSRSDVEVIRETHNQKVKSAKDAVERAELDVKTIPVLSAIQAERTRLALEEAKAEYEQLLTEVKYQRISEQAQLREEELEVREAEIELERTETGVDRLLVKAPLDGMVVRLNVFRNGEMGQVQEGDELWSGMPFLQVVDTSSMMVEANVNQVDAEKLRIGQKASVRFDAFPDLELPASVYSIGTVAKSRQYRKEFITEIPVLLKLERTEGRVIPDLSVSADVIIETEENAPQVPIAAVHYDRSTGRPYVYVKTAAGWDRRDVELGLRNNVKVAIRSGLQPGEEVALEAPAPAPARTD